MSDSNSSIRLAPLNGLRGLGFLMIVILHDRNLNDKWNDPLIYTAPFWDQPILVYKLGWLGVDSPIPASPRPLPRPLSEPSPSSATSTSSSCAP